MNQHTFPMSLSELSPLINSSYQQKDQSKLIVDYFQKNNANIELVGNDRPQTLLQLPSTNNFGSSTFEDNKISACQGIGNFNLFNANIFSPNNDIFQRQLQQCKNSSDMSMFNIYQYPDSSQKGMEQRKDNFLFMNNYQCEGNEGLPSNTDLELKLKAQTSSDPKSEKLQTYYDKFPFPYQTYFPQGNNFSIYASPTSPNNNIHQMQNINDSNQLFSKPILSFQKQIGDNFPPSYSTDTLQNQSPFSLPMIHTRGSQMNDLINSEMNKFKINPPQQLESKYKLNENNQQQSQQQQQPQQQQQQQSFQQTCQNPAKSISSSSLTVISQPCQEKNPTLNNSIVIENLADNSNFIILKQKSALQKDPSLHDSNFTSSEIIKTQEQNNQSPQSSDDIQADNEDNSPSRQNLKLEEFARKVDYCKCRKSKCLKLYCECFLRGNHCNPNCICTECGNIPTNEEEREKAKEEAKNRNAEAFNLKFQRTKNEVTHKRGCNCKKTHCLKKYCECFNGGLKCKSNCKCEECKNIYDNMKSQTLSQFVTSSEGDENLRKIEILNENNSIMENSTILAGPSIQESKHESSQIAPSFLPALSVPNSQISKGRKRSRSDLGKDQSVDIQGQHTILNLDQNIKKKTKGEQHPIQGILNSSLKNQNIDSHNTSNNKDKQSSVE